MLEDLQTDNGEQADRAEDWLFSIEDEFPSPPTIAIDDCVWKYSNGSSSSGSCNSFEVFFRNYDFVADSMSSQGYSSGSCREERSLTSIGDVLKLFGNPDSELLVESFSPRSDCNESSSTSHTPSRHRSRKVVLQKQVQKLKQVFEEKKLELPKKEQVVKPPSTGEREDVSYEHPGVTCKGSKPCVNFLARGTCRFREDCQFCHLHERRSPQSNPTQSTRLRAKKNVLQNYLKEQEEFLQGKILDD